MPTNCILAGLAAGAALFLAAPDTGSGIVWRNDIRESLAEAEGRGVPLLVYLSRDD